MIFVYIETFYRLPNAVMPVAKISKILFAMEGNGGEPLRLLADAKSLDDLKMDSKEGN